MENNVVKFHWNFILVLAKLVRFEKKKWKKSGVQERERPATKTIHFLPTFQEERNYLRNCWKIYFMHKSDVTSKRTSSSSLSINLINYKTSAANIVMFKVLAVANINQPLTYFITPTSSVIYSYENILFYKR